MFCQICGHVHKIDFAVPNEIWDEAIHPRFKDTHICLNCFIERADEKLLPWDKEIKLFPCSMLTQIEIQTQNKECSTCGASKSSHRDDGHCPEFLSGKFFGWSDNVFTSAVEGI